MKNKKISQALLLMLAVVILSVIFVLIVFLGKGNEQTEKVGFIMTGSAEDSGWNHMHYIGIEKACADLQTELILKENVSEGTGLCADAVRELADEGASMIILSSYGYSDELRDVVKLYPDIEFYGIYSDGMDDDITSYFGRMYQARYLSGIIAGLQTKTDVIGYVAAMNNNEVNRGINAFALGVKSVNSDAEIAVYFTDTWDDAEKEKIAANILINEKNADVLAYHQNRTNVIDAAEAAGAYSIGYNEAAEGYSDKYLTAAVWNWEKLYTEIVREFRHGHYGAAQRYWFGLETGSIGLSEYSPLVSDEARSAVEKAKNEILAGKDVFSGVIYDTEGILRCDEEESVSDDTLLERFDWFVEGVIIYEK